MQYLFQNRFLLRRENLLTQKTQTILNTLSRLPLPLPLPLAQDTALQVFDTIQHTTQQSQDFFENLRNISEQFSDVGSLVRSESTQEYLAGHVPVVGTTVAALLKKITF
jgi:hypothetical protein